MTLPSLAYAGIPYQVFGESSGALAVMMAWSRSAMDRSGSDISAILVSRSRSPAALSLFARASAFSSLARSFIAARSSAVNPSDVLGVAVVLLAVFCAIACFLLSARFGGDDHLACEPSLNPIRSPRRTRPASAIRLASGRRALTRDRTARSPRARPGYGAGRYGTSGTARPAHEGRTPSVRRTGHPAPAAARQSRGPRRRPRSWTRRGCRPALTERFGSRPGFCRWGCPSAWPAAAPRRPSRRTAVPDTAHRPPRHWPPRRRRRGRAGARCRDGAGRGGGGRHSLVLKQPEDVAIGVGNGGHQAAATDVVRGLLYGSPRRGHLGQLRLNVWHVL